MKIRFKQLYMDIAIRVAAMSQAERLKVGCVLVKDDRIISMSWNGTPNGWDNCCEDRIEHDGQTQLVTKPEVIHAESNCISKLARSRESGLGSTMFVTHAPCMECAKLIYQTGVTSVFYANEYKSRNGIDFLIKCGIHVEQMTINITQHQESS
jgi:dCMP deaminase